MPRMMLSPKAVSSITEAIEPRLDLLKQPHLQHLGLATLTGCQTFCAVCRPTSWRWRRIFLLPFLFILTAHAADSEISETNLIPQNISLWTESLLWTEQGDFSSGLGYNNNVLLSHFDPQGSAFVVNSLDWAAIRLPLDGWKIVAAIVGDDTRFWRDAGANNEDSFIASVDVQRELPDDWQAGAEIQGLYEKQVLDLSTIVSSPITALVQGYGLTAQPYLRKDLPAGFWLKLEMPVTRWYLQSPLDNYWDFGPVVTAGCDLGTRADVAMSYGVSWQPHDQWDALNDEDLPLPQHLEIFQQTLALAWHQYWDSQKRWRSSTRLTFVCREDNGAGYFNYYQYQASEDLRWHNANWQIKGSAQIVDEDYPIQGTGILNGQTLCLELLNFSLEVERRLYKRLKAFANVEYQQALSNYYDNAYDYNGTTVSGGLRLEF